MRSAIPGGLPAAPPAAAGDLAACDGVSVAYGEGAAQAVALSSADLAVGRGELISLVGASGSGKTTLLHVLGGLVVPTEGSVSWKGAPLSTLDAAARGRVRAGSIAYVFQGSNLLPYLSARENIEFATLVAAQRAQEREAPDAEYALALVGLAHKAEALPGELSGGEQQRVAIARAIAQAPELLLCDEPTGHLDSDTGSRVLDMLIALRAESGFTLVIATHDEAVAARAPRTVELAEGKITGAAR